MEGVILREGPLGSYYRHPSRGAGARTHHGAGNQVYFESPTLCHGIPSMDGLDDEQRRAVHLLQEISNTTDDDVAVGVLSSVDWDIQVQQVKSHSYEYISDRF